MIVPTYPADEASRGRIALWLDAEDLNWLAEFCGCPDDADALQRERCARIRFRANAALHKSGLKKDQP
jgi:hypothetical protein